MYECTEFVLLIKIQNTSISEVKLYIFNPTTNFVFVLPLSMEQLFFPAEVVLSRKFQIPRQKYIFQSQSTFFTEQLTM